jgi:hypothetical protein
LTSRTDVDGVQTEGVASIGVYAKENPAHPAPVVYVKVRFEPDDATSPPANREVTFIVRITE